jgi:hypothetical protein
MIDFFQGKCYTYSSRRVFGLCDDPPPAENPAYIDEGNGQNWIATVLNNYQVDIAFYGIDHCVELPKRADNTESQRCDGVLVHEDIIAFVELKSRSNRSSEWVSKAEDQLIETIQLYEAHGTAGFDRKKAYIANGEHPQARRGQASRIERFSIETGGYALYVKATIDLFSPEG